MPKLVILAISCGLTFFTLANGIFALRNPTGWLKARWTAKRSAKLDTPTSTVQEFGFIFTIGGILMSFICFKMILSLIRG